MTELITVNISLPEQRLFLNQAKMVSMPGSNGVFAVLKGHEPLIASLSEGVVHIELENKKEVRYFVHGGVADISASAVNILADYAIDLAKVSREEINKEIASLTMLEEYDKTLAEELAAKHKAALKFI